MVIDCEPTANKCRILGAIPDVKISRFFLARLIRMGRSLMRAEMA
jgi:hypothetical protein